MFVVRLLCQFRFPLNLGWLGCPRGDGIRWLCALYCLIFRLWLLELGFEYNIFITLCSFIYFLESCHAFDCCLFEVIDVFLVRFSAIFLKLVVSEIEFFRPLLDKVETEYFAGVRPRFVIFVHTYLV